MQPRLLIDGYNLLHAAGLSRRSFGPGGLERARERLLAALGDLLTDDERVRTVVVFDARGGDSAFRTTQRRRGLRVEFPARTREADDRIEDLIAENTAPRTLLVVSGDRRLQAAVARRGGTFETSGQFLARVHRRLDDAEAGRGEGAEEKPDPPAPTAGEIAAWTRCITGQAPDEGSR